jgi:CBS domain-containing protein
VNGKKTAEDIMVPINDYVTISQKATLYEAINVLRSSFHRDGRAWYGHRSVIVLGEDGDLVGVLSLNEILKAAGLRELDNDPDFKAESWGWYYINSMRQSAKLRVKDVMRPLAVATVDARDEAGEVALALLKHKVNSLPVLKNGKLVGMVRILDIFMVIGEYFF